MIRQSSMHVVRQVIQLQRSLPEMGVGEGLEAEPQSLFARKKEVAISSIARDHLIIGIMHVEDKPQE